jgi:hypothetical protein
MDKSFPGDATWQSHPCPCLVGPVEKYRIQLLRRIQVNLTLITVYPIHDSWTAFPDGICGYRTDSRPSLREGKNAPTPRAVPQHVHCGLKHRRPTAAFHSHSSVLALKDVPAVGHIRKGSCAWLAQRMRSFRGPSLGMSANCTSESPVWLDGSVSSCKYYPLRDQKNTLVCLDLSSEKDSSNMKPQSMNDVETAFQCLSLPK